MGEADARAGNTPDAKAAYPVTTAGADRGKVEKVQGEPPLAALCRALSAGGETAEAVAFGVRAKEGGQ